MGLARIPASPEDKEYLVGVVVDGNHPFTLVEQKSFRAVLERFKPGFIVPSAKTIREEAVRMYAREAARVTDRLRNVNGKISLTLDCWTSPNSKAFLGITAHYIDDTWVPRSLVLDFAHLPGMHTGKHLCDSLVGTCEKFGILGKILSITTDNASNIGSLLSCFSDACRERGVLFDEKQQHMRCMAHVANLAVQAFLRELRADASHGNTATQPEQLSCITKLRRLVLKIRSSTQRRNEFRDRCFRRGIPCREVIPDVRTRWNSTHAMIKRACEFRGPLSDLAKDKDDLPKLSDEDWKLLEAVDRVLRVFGYTTEELCATNYPTLNSAVVVYNHLFNKLEDFYDLCVDGADDASDDDSQDDETEDDDDDDDSQEYAAGGQSDEEDSQDDEDEDVDYQVDVSIINQCSPAMKSTLKNAIKVAHRKMRKYYKKTGADMYAIALILDPRYYTKT
jgi:hypothetical protein